MRQIGKTIITAILTFILSIQVHAQDCISLDLRDALAESIGASHRIFTGGRHVEKIVLDRKVLQLLNEIPIGKPSFIDASVHPSIRARIANGETNLDLMKSGNAPIGSDGKQVNLHHLFGLEPGPMAEITATEHKVNHAVLHSMIEDSFRRDGSKANSYDAFRKAYWKERARELGS